MLFVKTSIFSRTSLLVVAYTLPLVLSIQLRPLLCHCYCSLYSASAFKTTIQSLDHCNFRARRAFILSTNVLRQIQASLGAFILSTNVFDKFGLSELSSSQLKSFDKFGLFEQLTSFDKFELLSFCPFNSALSSRLS